jgi:3-isopropylmalate/(R)-2-methylmalate dehydratase large subunit
MATQCLLQSKPKLMRINVEGDLHKGVVSKDIILYIIAQISASGATGYFVEYAGSAIRSLSMEGRMTICNMSIEMGARGGMIAPDETTFAYLKGRPSPPKEPNGIKNSPTGKHYTPTKTPASTKRSISMPPTSNP